LHGFAQTSGDSKIFGGFSDITLILPASCTRSILSFEWRAMMS
jgi:muramoyltetrapeptide carboxypeptidase LdcA involved in peptidoglycan recycling